MAALPSEELRTLPWMFVIFLTENFKFLSRFTYSNGPIERAGKVWWGFPGRQVIWKGVVVRDRDGQYL